MKKGFIAILTVLTLMVFSLSLSIAVTYLSIGEAQSGLALARGTAALNLAEGCAADALLLAKRDLNYAGGNYAYLGGTCAVDVSKDGTLWTLVISGAQNNFTKKIRVTFEYTAGPPGIISLRSWLEQ